MHLDGSVYHFSWIPHPDKAFSWQRARKYCAGIGMAAIAMDTEERWKLVKDVFYTGTITTMTQEYVSV